MVRARNPFLLVGILAALIVTGCDEQEARTSRPVFDGTLFDVIFGPRSVAPLNDRLEVLTAECMTERGWVYTPRTGTTVAAFVLLGLSESQFAEMYGFAITRIPDVPDPAGDPANTSYVESLTESSRRQYSAALNECDGEAKVVVDMLSKEVAALTTAYREEVWVRLQASPTGQAAIDAWRSCVDSELANSAVDRSDLVREVEEYLAMAGLNEADAWTLEVELAMRELDCAEQRREAERIELDRLESEFIDNNSERVAFVVDLYRTESTGATSTTTQ